MRAHRLGIEAPRLAASRMRAFFSGETDSETVLCLAFMLIVGFIVKFTPP